MKQSARLREIIGILNANRNPVPQKYFLDALEISTATFKRDLAELRDKMQAPIEWVGPSGSISGGYVLSNKSWASGKHSLPNAWFTSAELVSVLMIDELSRHIGPGLLSEHLKDLIPRITMALSASGDSAESIRARIQILTSSNKRTPSACFDVVAQCTVKNERINITYYTRGRNERSDRIVSPQRLLHYKENWYLIAWCHKSEGLRIFSLDAIEWAVRINQGAKTVEKKQVDSLINNGFGIYSGPAQEWAVLRFNKIQAPWIIAEQWHPDQQGTLLSDGSYQLRVPFSNANELMLEILKYGENVEVLEPSSLRETISARLKTAANMYS